MWNRQTELHMQEVAAISSHGYSFDMLSLIYSREAATSTNSTYQSLCSGISMEETDTRAARTDVYSISLSVP